MNVSEFQERARLMEARGMTRPEIAAQFNRVLNRQWAVIDQPEPGSYEDWRYALTAPSGARMEAFPTRELADARLAVRQKEEDCNTADLVEHWLTVHCDMPNR